MSTSLSRRTFLKGSIAVTIGTLVGFPLASCATGSEPEVNEMHVKLHRGYAAAHGDQCFTQVVVAVGDDNKILGASVDDYQFMSDTTEGITPVPNSDGTFGEGIVAGMMLISKYDNSPEYSKHMAEGAEATTPWAVSMDAITQSVVGKTPDELTSIDSVSGSTLVDTPNYLKAISDVAGDETLVSEGVYSATDLSIGRVNANCHGPRGFGDAVSLVLGGTLVATNLDEFEFMAADTPDLVPVPNSDKAFGENYAPGQVLFSKGDNNTVYSKHMVEVAQTAPTQDWLTSIHGIETYCAGKEVDGLSVSGPDDVSGATLTDTANYVTAADDAAKAAKPVQTTDEQENAN